jgi:flagellar biosynthesis/type III secretory pathway protein FliH
LKVIPFSIQGVGSREEVRVDPEQLVSSLPTALKELVITAITESAEQRQAREHAAFRDGYLAGFDAGQEIGYGRAHEEMAQAWHAAHTAVQRHARMATFAELERARRTPTHTHKERKNAA